MTHPRFTTAAFLLSLAACGPSEMPVAAPTPPPSAEIQAPPVSADELPISQTTPGPIPLEFRHVWAIEPADCTTEPALTRIAIAPGAIKFYEGRSEVVSAETAHERALVLNVTHSAEGQTSTEKHTLALDDTSSVLTYNRNGSTFTYKRCD